MVLDYSLCIDNSQSVFVEAQKNIINDRYKEELEIKSLRNTEYWDTTTYLICSLYRCRPFVPASIDSLSRFTSTNSFTIADWLLELFVPTRAIWHCRGLQIDAVIFRFRKFEHFKLLRVMLSKLRTFFLRASIASSIPLFQIQTSWLKLWLTTSFLIFGSYHHHR